MKFIIQYIITFLKCYIGTFISRQDARLKIANLAAYQATGKYVSAAEKKCPKDRRVTLFQSMHRIRNDYYVKVESEILKSGNLSGEKYAQWVQEWTISATKVLSGAIRYQEYVRRERVKLDLPTTVYEPSDGAYRSIQAFYADVMPSEAVKMKAEFGIANLPTSGFDHPYKPKPSEKKNMPSRAGSFLIIVITLTLLAVLAHFIGYILLPLIGFAIVIYFSIEINDLLRNAKLKDKTYYELAKIVLEKRFKMPKRAEKKKSNDIDNSD